MSQKDAAVRTIGGHSYKVYKMEPRRAMRLLLRLGKCVGPSIGGLIDGVVASKKSILEVSTESRAFQAAIAELFDRLDESTLDFVIDSMMELSEVDNKPLKGIYSAHFFGKVGDQLKWLAFALEAQYGDFFGGLASGLAGVATPAMEDKSPA